MKFIDGKICLVNVNVTYLHELHKASNEVPFAEGYKNKPFIGAGFKENDSCDR